MNFKIIVFSFLDVEFQMPFYVFAPIITIDYALRVCVKFEKNFNLAKKQAWLLLKHGIPLLNLSALADRQLHEA